MSANYWFCLVLLCESMCYGQTFYVQYLFAGECDPNVQPKTQQSCLRWFEGNTEASFDTTTEPTNPSAYWEFDCTVNKDEVPNSNVTIPLRVRGVVDLIHSTTEVQSGRIRHIEPYPPATMFFDAPAGELVHRDIINPSLEQEEYYNIQIKNFLWDGASSPLVPCLSLLVALLYAVLF